MVSPDDQQPPDPQKPASGDPPAAVPETRTASGLIALCAVCGADISRSSLVFQLPTAPQPVLVVAIPLRCPECNAPTTERQPRRGVMVPLPGGYFGKPS